MWFGFLPGEVAFINNYYLCNSVYHLCTIKSLSIAIAASVLVTVCTTCRCVLTSTHTILLPLCSTSSRNKSQTVGPILNLSLSWARSQDSVVKKLTRPWTGQSRVRFSVGAKDFLFPETSRSAVGPTQPPILRFSPTGKVGRTWSWPFTSIWCSG